MLITWWDPWLLALIATAGHFEIKACRAILPHESNGVICMIGGRTALAVCCSGRMVISD